MNLFTNLLTPLAWPASGLWETIIKWLSGVGNMGLAIILMTLSLKIVLLPLDFWQKSVARKMSVQQLAMQPELEAAQKKCGNNKELLQRKQMEIYRKYNINPLSSLLSMIVYLVVTMVVFFTLFSGLNNISRIKINYEYYQLEQEYRAVYDAKIAEPDVEKIAQDAVAAKYDEIREGFLSIKNIWRPDNWSSVFPTASNFVSSTGTSLKTFKYEAGNLTYIYLSTNAETYTDASENKYVEPYVDLDGNIYAIFDTSETATNPDTVNIGDKTYNVIYPTIFTITTNDDVDMTYFYQTTQKTNTYKNNDKTNIIPYSVDNTIYAIENTDPEATNPDTITINGKTYNVDYTKNIITLTEEALNGKAVAEKTRLYNESTSFVVGERFAEDFATVTKGINEKYQGQWNGFAILILLAMAVTFLSSYFSQAGIRAKDARGNIVKKQKPKPTMGIIMAIIMLFFTMSYTSAFALYIVTNSVASILLTYLTNIVLNKIEDKKDKKNTVVADYVRK
ncbi:MAG: YidC/Oxa1 family membrane protein insertase [Clostridia bacterium]|nr:YidC/Oxa1 family membrane protein insertase [Clostridia bacterium]